ncbi:MAG: helix-turn-helix domain-containing protein [Mycobacteriales bacterium]
MANTNTACNCRLEVVRMLRIMNGMSLKQLADATDGIADATGSTKGLSAAYIHQLETGRIDAPSPHNLFKLSQALNFSYPRLMELAGYAYEGADGSTVEGDGDAEGLDRFTALIEAVAEADIHLRGKELFTGAIREYERCWKAGIEPPADLLGTVLRGFHRIHEAGGTLDLEDITAQKTAA